MKLVLDMTSNEYHSEREHFSSSQLKDILYSEELFYKKHITKELEREENAVFDIGTYFHTAVLEPHLLDKECAVYESTRHGAKWETFKLENKGKAIITKGEKVKAMNCVAAIRQCPISMAYVNMGTPEVSAFLRLYVYEDRIYYLRGENTFVMTYSGWKTLDPDYSEGIVDAIYEKSAVEVGVKVRADSIALEGVTVSDLKSSSGDVSDEFSVKNKTSDYCYDLSAALYLDIFSAVIGKQYTDFIWLYASKDLHDKLKAPIGKPWRASANNILIGRSKWTRAIIDIAYYQSINWKLDSKKVILHDLEPKEHELVWLNKKHLDKSGEFELSDLSDVVKQIEIDKTKPVKDWSLTTKQGNDMKIVDARYERVFKTGEYESEKIGFTATLDEDDTAEGAIEELKKAVEAQRTIGASVKSETKKESSKKLEVSKEEKAPKEEKKEKAPKVVKATAYVLTDDKQRAAVGSLVDKIIPGWREKAEAKAAAKKASAELDGQDFMDEKGTIIDSFVEKLKAKLAAFIDDGDDL